MPKPISPTINWNNPLTKGLIFDMPEFEGGGTNTLEIVQKRLEPISGPTWKKDHFGNVLDFTNTTDRVNATAPTAFSTLPAVSIECYIYYRTQGGSSAGRVFQRVDASNVLGYVLELGGTNTLDFAAHWTTTDGEWLPANGTLTANKWYHVVVTYSWSSTANVPIFYVNAVTKPIATTSGTPTGNANNVVDTNIFVGNAFTGTDRHFDGRIAYLRFWNRILSPNEVKQLYSNPFQIYKQPTLPTLYNTLAAVVVNSFIGFRTLLGVGL